METSLNLANSAKCAQLRLQPVTAGRLPKSLVLWPRPMQLSLSSLCSTILTPKRLFTTPMCPSPFKVRGQIGAHCVSINFGSAVIRSTPCVHHGFGPEIIHSTPGVCDGFGPGPCRAECCRREKLNCDNLTLLPWSSKSSFLQSFSFLKKSRMALRFQACCQGECPDDVRNILATVANQIKFKHAMTHLMFYFRQ